MKAFLSNSDNRCGVAAILAPSTNFMAYLLTYLPCISFLTIATASFVRFFLVKNTRRCTRTYARTSSHRSNHRFATSRQHLPVVTTATRAAHFYTQSPAALFSRNRRHFFICYEFEANFKSKPRNGFTGEV